MSDTYERKQERGTVKERYEWIHSWCDEATENDLPRLLLIGDSICNGYQGEAREMLRGVAYVDYIASSYSLDNPFLSHLLTEMAKNSRYDLIFFNNGLHGYHLSARSYRSRYAKLLSKLLATGARVIPVTTTSVYKNGKERLDTSWKKKCAERNAAARELAEGHGLPVCDLHAVCEGIPYAHRSPDGFHYTGEGYRALAEEIVKTAKAVL